MYFAAISMFTFDGQRPKSISVQNLGGDVVLRHNTELTA
jgi:hypothetical protein